MECARVLEIMPWAMEIMPWAMEIMPWAMEMMAWATPGGMFNTRIQRPKQGLKTYNIYRLTRLSTGLRFSVAKADHMGCTWAMEIMPWAMKTMLWARKATPGG